MEYPRRAMMRVKAPRGSKDILYGQPPYGWKLSKDRSKLVRDPDEQRIIAMIRNMYFIRKLTMRDIVAELAAMGIVNRRGHVFVLSRVCELLHTDKKAPPEAG